MLRYLKEFANKQKTLVDPTKSVQMLTTRGICKTYQISLALAFKVLVKLKTHLQLVFIRNLKTKALAAIILHEDLKQEWGIAHII